MRARGSEARMATLMAAGTPVAVEGGGDFLPRAMRTPRAITTRATTAPVTPRIMRDPGRASQARRGSGRGGCALDGGAALGGAGATAAAPAGGLTGIEAAGGGAA